MRLINGEALEEMDKLIEEGIKIDAVICDPPYGVTGNKWDEIIPINSMWEKINKLIKEDGIIILFSDGLFTSKLKLSNEKNWKYDLIWDKVLSSGFLNAKKRPLRRHEMISIFYNKYGTYNPQKVKGNKNHGQGSKKEPIKNTNYGNFKYDKEAKNDGMKYPVSILRFQKPTAGNAVHPTQKPTEVMEYLIKTYTNENETVLDFTMGSGSTGVACVKTNRKFIGIELDPDYYNIAVERINTVENKITNEKKIEDILDEF